MDMKLLLILRVNKVVEDIVLLMRLRCQLLVAEVVEVKLKKLSPAMVVFFTRYLFDGTVICIIMNCKPKQLVILESMKKREVHLILTSTY